MNLIHRLNRAPVYLPVVMALVLILTLLVVVQARAVLPNPVMLSQYDVRVCSADDIDDCDPRLDSVPATATVTDVEGLNVGLVHHLDVDGDGAGDTGGGCAAWHQLGEVAGRCDNKPDLTVQVSIESSVGQTAPIMRINRAPSAILENRPAPPTRVDITYTVTDTAGVLPDMEVGFGYATPPGGTIPLKLSAYVLGMLPPLDADASWVPFNPMTLVVDSGQFTTLSGAAPVAPSYAGPLTVTGAFAMPATNGDDAIDVDVELTYMPMPEKVAVEWERDDPSSHRILYGHDAPGHHEHVGNPDCGVLDDPPVSGCPRDVDLQARVRAISGSDPDPAQNEYFQVDARIDRLPSFLEVDVDMLTEEGRRNQGAVDLTVPTSALLPSGYLPDARFDILSRVPNSGPDAADFPVDVQAVTAHIEQMPTQMQVEWYVPEKDDVDGAPGCAAVTTDLPDGVSDPCLARALFTVPSSDIDGPYMGGVELSVANFEGASPVLDRFLPGWNQYVNLQSAPVSPDSARLHQLLTARIERVRNVLFAETPDGFEAHAQLGDGAQPLQVNIGTDERTVERHDEPGVFGVKMDAELLVSPLPDDLSIAVEFPDDGDGPLVVAWDAGESIAPSIDIHGTIELRGQPAEDDAACGRPHTVCATLQVDHVPDVGTLRVDIQDDETAIALDTTPSVDESLDVIIGLVARPCAANAPIVADVDLRRVPQHVRARAVTPVVAGDPDAAAPVCAIDRPDVPPEPDAPERDLSRFELHPCDYDDDARACRAGTEGAFGAITVAARNFIDRPDELPHVPIVTTPMYVSAALRDADVNVDPNPTDDNLFEVEARLLEVRELQVVQHEGTIGGRLRAGSDTTGDGAGDDPLMVAFDLANVLLDPDDPDATRQDLRGHALLEPLPTHVDLCFRPPGGKLVDSPGDPLTATCENAQPFGPDTPVTVAPTSLAIDSSAEFALDAFLELVDRGLDASDSATGDDRTVRASLQVAPVPSDGVGNQPDLVVHLQTPEEDADVSGDATSETESAVRLQFDAVDPSEPIMVDFSAEILDGDMFCTDPRLAPEIDPDPETGDRRFQEALCMSGRIEHLPTNVTLLYDPETEGENFRFEHNGTDVNLVDLRLTSVTAEVDPGFDEEFGTDDDTVLPAVLVVEGELLGLPPLMKGTIVPPGTVVLRSVDPATEVPGDPDAEQDGAPVDQVSIVARNFIAPDPMPTMPAQRVLEGGPLPEPDHVLQIFRRNELFKAIVEVGALVKAGFETQRDVDGNFLDTNVLTVDFGEPDDVVRGYADLQAPTERNNPETPVDEARESMVAIIADVTLQDKPAGVTVCFRGEREHPAPPVSPVFCDTAPPPDGGALQVQMRPFDDGATERRLDIDAFLRLASAGGGDVLSATTRIDNMPHVVQGVFSDGGADFEGLDLAGQPQGIDAIRLELANFDLHEDAAGYGNNSPWSGRVDGPGWTAPGGAHEPGEISFSRDPISDYFARLRTLNETFFVQFAFGVVDTPGTPDSNLQRVSFADSPCPAPTDPPASDYPHFPDDLNSEYTCLRGFFELHEGGSQEPLFLEVVTDDGPERTALNAQLPHDDNRFARAGLSRLPVTFQATMASTVTLDETTALRDPCGPHLAHAPNDVSCMPPLLRMDIEPNGPMPAFFGMVELGRRDLLALARSENPRESIAGGDAATTTALGRGLAEPPGVDGFEAWPDGHGLRGRIVSFNEEEHGHDDDVVILGLHVPLAGSLTFDQLQKWGCTNGSPDCPGTTEEAPPPGESQAENSDLRLRYVARDVDGQVVDSIGQLALMVADEKQILLADPDNPAVAGVSLPGELGLQMYKRELWEPEDDDAKFSRSFMQVDGRASSPIALGARIFSQEVRRIHAIVRGTGVTPEGDTDPLSPSFRLRAGIDKNTSMDDDDDDCIIYVVFNFCKSATIHDIGVDIDYRDAARVDAYVVVDKPENAVELRGYDVFHGTAIADQSPIDVDISADLDIFIWLMIPIVLNIIADLNISADMDVDTAEQFRWRNNLLRMTAAHRGDAGGVDIDVGIVPFALAGLLLIPIPFFTIVWGFAYVWPPNLGPMLVQYKPCHTAGGSLGGFSVDAGDTVSRYADPTVDPRLIEFGTASIGSWLLRFISVTNPIIGPGSGLLGIAAWAVSCVWKGQTDLPLIADGVEVGPPTAVAGHPVPGFGTQTVTPLPPPAPAELQDLDIDGAVSMCGTHVHRRIRVLDGGSLTVATGGDCPSGGDSGNLRLIAQDIEVSSGGTIDVTNATGQVELNAENLVVASGGTVTGGTHPVVFTVVELLQIDGAVTADAVRAATSFGGATPASGNSGAGHGGAGGDGSHGSGGHSYGDTTLDPDEDTGLVTMEPGSRGAGTSGVRGAGGGQFQLSASQIRVSGLLSAAGGDAVRSSQDASRQCSVPDDPDTEEDESEENTGLAGPGGGSGGTVVLRAQKVDATGGTISVRGGAGADGKGGGGGGGAAGHLKLAAPIYDGSPLDRSGGAGGSSLCPDDFEHGQDGSDGPIIQDRSPSSRVAPLAGRFFHQGVDLELPLRAAAREVGASGGFQVMLCGLRRPPEAILADDEDSAEASFGIEVPSPGSQSITDPCGSAVGDTTVHRLGHVDFPSTTLTPDGTTIPATHTGGSVDITGPSGNGFWGMYTIVAKPGTPGNDCFDHTDFEFLGSGEVYDALDCTLEAIPVEPDAILGIDNTAPEVGSVAISSDANGNVATTGVQVSIGDVTDDMPFSVGDGVVEQQSGVRTVQCRNEGTSDWQRCGVGTFDWDLTPGLDGDRTLEVRAIDMAGNVSETATATVTLDSNPPSFALSVIEPPDGNNDWYRHPPSFRLDSFDDAGGSGPGDPVPYQYWFNGGSQRSCLLADLDDSDPVCIIDSGVPTLGVHRLQAAAIDDVGHRSEIAEEIFRTDNEPPHVALLTAPFEPDAANGWFGQRPWVVVSALDQPLGSGLEPVDADDLDTGVFRDVNGAGFVRSPEMFTLGGGDHEVCFYAVDQAGNPSAGDAGSPDPACEPVRVDVEDPDVSFDIAPADGDNGWHVTPPTVVVNASDPSSGVGSNGQQCAPLATPTGVCLSRDLTAWEPGPSGTSRTFDVDGVHSLRAFATDRSGKRSALGVLEVKVDLTAPVTMARTQPPAPTRNDRYRVEPEVHLSAHELHMHNSGVDRVEWCLQDTRSPVDDCSGPGDFNVYDGPFLVPDGDWELHYRAVDLAGNVEDLQVLPLVVDTTTPTVEALAADPNPISVGDGTTLHWTVFDDLSDAAEVAVYVYGWLPAVGFETLRRIELGTVDPSPLHEGSNGWDGMREFMDSGSLSLAPVLGRPLGGTTGNCLPLIDPLCEVVSGGPLPLVGRYWYQVVVTDQAGNVSHSGESVYIQVNLL